MFLSFVYRTGQEPQPELCLVAEKRDDISPPVNVDCLVDTDAALIRIGTIESIVVKRAEDDGGTIVKPVTPSRLYLTPLQPDIPGFSVRQAKILKRGEGNYQILYQNDTEIERGVWAEWIPWEGAR